MKEKIIVERLIKFLQPYETYYITEEPVGVYRLENKVKLTLPGLPNFDNYGKRYVTVNLNDMSISYKLTNYSGDKIQEGVANWADHIEDIINQLSQKAKWNIDYSIKSEDCERMRKSRECRVNRRLKSLMEVVV